MAYDRASLFVRLRSYLLDNPYASLSDVATRLGVERHTIQQIVRQESGGGFREFQHSMRLRAAERLLAMQAGASVKEIAGLLGYSPRAFSRFFRCATGKSPSEYRDACDRAYKENQNPPQLTSLSH